MYLSAVSRDSNYCLVSWIVTTTPEVPYPMSCNNNISNVSTPDTSCRTVITCTCVLLGTLVRCITQLASKLWWSVSLPVVVILLNMHCCQINKISAYLFFYKMHDNARSVTSHLSIFLNYHVLCFVSLGLEGSNGEKLQLFPIDLFILIRYSFDLRWSFGASICCFRAFVWLCLCTVGVCRELS